MKPTRRDLCLLLPGLLASAEATTKPVLLSKTYESSSLPIDSNPRTNSEIRQVFDGLTHEGFAIDLHITTLPPGEMPHPAHHHVWEEMIFVQSGTVEVNIKGSVTRIGAGSVAYVASNEQHGWKNVGDTPAKYFVLAIGHRS